MIFFGPRTVSVRSAWLCKGFGLFECVFVGDTLRAGTARGPKYKSTEEQIREP